ncbi:MFS transporter, partial [cyanobacterium TDX16]
MLGFQQASSWGWTDPKTLGCIAVGLVLLVGFVLYEHRPASPLVNMKIFRVRAFFVQNAVLFFSMMAFVPVFFFASMYAQISLGSDSSEAGLYLLTFFAGYAPAAQLGGRMLDSIGAKRPVVVGCVVAAVGFYLWAGQVTDIDAGLNGQWYYIVLTGAGMGLMLGPANTDAINRAPITAYGEATGITQTVRNYGSAVGMAVLGTLLINQNRSNIEDTLGGFGLSKSQADEVAQSLSQTGGGDT